MDKKIEPIQLDIDPETGLEIPEEWRDVPGYEGIYWVSNYGRIKNLYGKLRKPSPAGDGYLIIGLFFKVPWVHVYVHRLVMAVFDKPCELQVDHINTIKKDNRFRNLRYGTHRQNSHWYHTPSGATFDSGSTSHKKWKAAIRIKGKNKNLGRFHTKDEAEQAYQKALAAL